MIRTTLTVVVASLISIVAAQAQPDSLIIGTIVEGNVVPSYSETTLTCAMETVFGTGVAMNSASIDLFGSGWALFGTGTLGSNSLDAAFRLTQNGSTLWLRAAARWDKCEGVDCSSCRLRLDEQGNAYCECLQEVQPNGFCNHSMGTGFYNLISAIRTCTD